MKNLLTQWETEEENLKINLKKNFLTQWKTKEKNQKTVGNVLLIDRIFAKLENDIECTSL